MFDLIYNGILLWSFSVIGLYVIVKGQFGRWEFKVGDEAEEFNPSPKLCFNIAMIPVCGLL